MKKGLRRLKFQENPDGAAQLLIGLFMAPHDWETGFRRLIHTVLSVAVWFLILDILLKKALTALPSYQIPFLETTLVSALTIAFFYLAALCLGFFRFFLLFIALNVFFIGSQTGWQHEAMLSHLGQGSVWKTYLGTYIAYAFPALLALGRPLILLTTLVLGCAAIALLPFLNDLLPLVDENMRLASCASFIVATLIAKMLHTLYYPKD